MTLQRNVTIYKCTTSYCILLHITQLPLHAVPRTRSFFLRRCSALWHILNPFLDNVLTPAFDFSAHTSLCTLSHRASSITRLFLLSSSPVAFP